MNQELVNTIGASGTYNNVPLTLASDPVSVTMVSGLTLSIAADKQAWASGPLTYTVTIDNQTSLPFVSPVLSDTLSPTLISLVDDSVMIDETKATAEQFKYDTTTGILTVNLSDVTASGKTTVTFQVNKKVS